MVILSKSDLLDQAKAHDLTRKLIADTRDAVRVIAAKNGAVDPAILLGLGVGAEDDMAVRHEIHHHHHHDDDEDDHEHEHEHGHDEFESFVVDLPEIDAAESLIDRINSAARDHGLLRVKGFAAVQGKPMRLVLQAVGPRVDHYFDRPFTNTESRATRLVVIGLAGLDRQAISRALAA